MPRFFMNITRLTRAAAVIAWHGAAYVPKQVPAPVPARLLRQWRSGGKKPSKAVPQDALPSSLARSLEKLGPSYIKLGQFLATRPDIIGAGAAGALNSLRDRLPPFSITEARHEIETALGKPLSDVFEDFGPPIAAASIAQVHKASVPSINGSRAVAVKILRPGIEARFAKDLDSFFFAARAVERFHAPSRRLRPVAAVDTLAKSVAVEMDLRLEAAAMSEMAENIAKAGDEGFRIPGVDWTRTARRVLTMDFVDGVPLSNRDAIHASGLDPRALGLNVIRSFLRHAIRDGFFHADMHQGNLFADPANGDLIAVDFGIMGRLGVKERRFLAEILYGFIIRDYRRIADVHFEAGYVPATEDVATFSQALRAIGEPLMDRLASEISMARVLTQLLQVTGLFNMRMRPELIMLQKTMVVVEGVARDLDPDLNMWVAAEPVVRAFMEGQLGPSARMREAANSFSALASSLAEIPKVLNTLERLGRETEDSARRVDNVRQTSRLASYLAVPLWLAAGALVLIAWKLWV
jgi:ubiquinone biosynthesis protein